LYVKKRDQSLRQTHQGTAVMTNLKHRIGRSAICALVAASTSFATSAALAASATAAATSIAALPRYNGLWSVSIITEKGTCDPGYRYPIRITNGVLQNAGDTPFVITGKVAPTGAITVTVSHGNSSATGSGRLAGDAGEGFWSGGQCSGSWTAERRSS
jgi:hypothetical protein